MLLLLLGLVTSGGGGGSPPNGFVAVTLNGVDVTQNGTLVYVAG